MDHIDPWRTAIHILGKPKGNSAPPDEHGRPTDAPFDDLEHILLLWATPLINRPSDGIRVSGCIIDVAGSPRAIKEIEANLNGGDTDTIALSSGMLEVDKSWLRRGIASLALERLVEWAKRYHSDRQVAMYNIGPYNDEKQDYLRRLFGTFGFFWSEKRLPDNSNVWKSNKMPVSDLKLKTTPHPTSAAATADSFTAYVEGLRVSLCNKGAALRVSERKNESRELSLRERISGMKESNASSRHDRKAP